VERPCLQHVPGLRLVLIQPRAIKMDGVLFRVKRSLRLTLVGCSSAVLLGIAFPAFSFALRYSFSGSIRIGLVLSGFATLYLLYALGRASLSIIRDIGNTRYVCTPATQPQS